MGEAVKLSIQLPLVPEVKRSQSEAAISKSTPPQLRRLFMSHSVAAPNFALWAVLTNAHTIKYSPVRTLRPLLLTLFLSHLLHTESHNNTQNIDHPRCSKQPSHRDYPDNLSHHSVPTLQQPTQLHSPHHFRLSLPGNSDFKHSFALSLQSSNRHNTFTRV